MSAWFIDTGDMEPGERDDVELDARDERARARDDAREESCPRHYPVPRMDCPACGVA